VEAHEDRARGALVGTAFGDALGAPFEGSATVGPAAVEDVLSGGDRLRYTDDTAMTIVLAEHLAEHGDVQEDALIRAFARAHRDEPWRGYGAGPPRIFRAVAGGTPWRQAATELFGGEGSFGNGGAMRVAPVALVAAPDLPRVAHLARRSAAVTHAHPLGRDGAAVQACAVAIALAGEIGDTEGALATLVEHAETPELRERLGRVRDVVVGGPSPTEIAAALGNGITALEAVPAAVAAALTATTDPATAVRTAILFGGDTDTIAAMAGAIAGAQHGVSAFPAGWQDRVEGAAELVDLADGLLGAGGWT
jgi:poly(ADP-ribose) glycohydrolase ARH3